MPSALPDGQPVPDDGALPAAALAQVGERPLSIYLHVPFCRTRCGYCDFNTYTSQELAGMSREVYVEAAHRELDLARRQLGVDAPAVSTVFVGGGTPTMLDSKTLNTLVAHVREAFGLAPEAEVTTEANPDTVDLASLEALREGGFTRVSLGMQSAIPHVLATLERQHTPGRALQAANWAAQAGFEHISLDLIYGTPGESMADWQASLHAVAEAPVDHVSAYSLIVEPGTRLAMQVRRGELEMPDEDDLAEKYQAADEALHGIGLRNYEVSNWAAPGGECRHNLAYWKGHHWWGIGPGAHSHIGGVRFWNRKHPRSYAQVLLDGHTPAQGREVLTPEQRRVERVLLELRLAEGLDERVLRPSERRRVPAIVQRALATNLGGKIVLTQQGRLLADGVVRDLLD